jgi:hypothetical protein
MVYANAPKAKFDSRRCAEKHFPLLRATYGGSFDAKYYGEKVIPLMISLYGSKDIRRVEFTRTEVH